jgi:hypothetical protein
LPGLLFSQKTLHGELRFSVSIFLSTYIRIVVFDLAGIFITKTIPILPSAEGVHLTSLQKNCIRRIQFFRSVFTTAVWPSSALLAISLFPPLNVGIAVSLLAPRPCRRGGVAHSPVEPFSSGNVAEHQLRGPDAALEDCSPTFTRTNRVTDQMPNIFYGFNICLTWEAEFACFVPSEATAQSAKPPTQSETIVRILHDYNTD